VSYSARSVSWNTSVYVFPIMAVTGVAVGVVNVRDGRTLFAVQTPELLRGPRLRRDGRDVHQRGDRLDVLGGLLLTVVSPRTIFQLAGVVSTLTVGVVGPSSCVLSRRAHAPES